MFVDSGPRDPYPLRRKMSAGDVWTIDHKVGFDTDVTVKLWEEDTTSFDDQLASHTIAATAVAAEEVELGDVSGGSFFVYRLKYTVTALPGVQKVDHEIDRLAPPTASSTPATGSPLWSYVTPFYVAARLRTLVGSAGGTPQLVDQGSTPFCGLAGLAYELAERRPARLVRFCQALLDEGSCLFAEDDCEVSDDLRDSSLPGTTGQAEWLFCASMRESNHRVMDVQDDMFMDNPFSLLHAGWPVGLAELATNVLGYGPANVLFAPAALRSIEPFLADPIEIASEEEILRRAGQARGNQGLGLLLIDFDLLPGRPNPPGSNVLVTTTPGKIFRYPNHYVSCLSPSPVSGTSVDFTVQSWGGTLQVQMSLDDVAPYIFGVIAVEP